MQAYFRHTSTLSWSFLACIPLLILYESLILISQPGQETLIRLGADIWIKNLLWLIHEDTLLVTAGLAIAAGIAIYYAERKKDIVYKPSYFGWMVAESIFWAIVLAFGVASVTGFFFGMIAAPPEPTRLQMLALSIGAGLYEELIFRVVLVYALLQIFKLLFEYQTAAAFAVILAAAIFSWVHYIGTYGDVFTLSSFMFRMIFGLVLNALLVLRGFGITAWTHSMYDVLLVVFFYP